MLLFAVVYSLSFTQTPNYRAQPHDNNMTNFERIIHTRLLCGVYYELFPPAKHIAHTLHAFLAAAAKEFRATIYPPFGGLKRSLVIYDRSPTDMTNDRGKSVYHCAGNLYVNKIICCDLPARNTPLSI